MFNPIVTKQCTIYLQIFLHILIFQFSNIFTSKRRRKKEHEEADFEKRMEISRKVQTFLHTSQGEKEVSIGHFSSKYIDRPLNEASKMSKNESFCEKTYEIGRLLEINRHPPTFPLNKSARHQNFNLEKLFSSHSSPSS